MTSIKTLTLVLVGADLLVTSSITYAVHLMTGISWYISIIVYTVLWLSAMLFIAWLLRNELRVSLAEMSILQAAACRECSYMFLRDVLTCNLDGSGAISAAVCISFQDNRLYFYRYYDATPTKDPRDFPCVRFEAGLFDSAGPVSVFKGKGMFLLPSGNVQRGDIEVYYTNYNDLNKIGESLKIILKTVEVSGL
ncbi:hypothetical protein [Acidilobus saccharovorans]|uniref:hypothetical protein n=1 Tax=Acidilobus saccharovorans TaxID=242703 RepID=UPI0011D0A8FF|nr:hypothetical protein [Acidilobus saccharovorans]